jgi:nucleoside phosphorylase
MENKKVLVAIATKKEFLLICEELAKVFAPAEKDDAGKHLSDNEYRAYTGDGIDIEVRCVGVGYLQAAITCNDYFNRVGKLPVWVVNAGFCVADGKHFPAGTVVHPATVMQYDFNLPDYYNQNAHLLHIWGNRYQIMQSMNYVPEITDSNSGILQLCDMEAFGVGLACKQKRIKVVLYKKVAPVSDIQMIHSPILAVSPSQHFQDFPAWLEQFINQK